MICVLATIQVAEGQRNEFLDEFRKVIPKVLAEEGCIEYGPMVDIETTLEKQPPVRPDSVTIVEKWEDIASLEAHLMAPHMNEYRKTVKDLVVDSSLLVLEPTGE
ncbi:MAG: putative quinol monooxygenase [Planctomycetia bacterium]|jgi:quinol monooxygenase YgiN